jgi:hypothetical protein
MHPRLYSVLALLVPSLVQGAVLPRDVPDEIIYLSNCVGQSNILESQMDYYKEYANSKAGQIPDSIAYVAVGGDQQWEQGSSTGYFVGSGGVSFTVSGLDINTPIGSSTGSGYNCYGVQFTCYREPELELYSYEGNTCTKIYSCAHSNHIVFTQTKVGLNSGTINVNNAVSGSDAFSNAYSAYDSTSAICSDTQYQIGSGCTISFQCTASDPNVFNAMAGLLVATAGSQVMTEQITIPPSCPSNGECVKAPGVFKCCDSTQAEQSTFPNGGTITSFNIDEANPDNPSIQASLDFSVTCPAPPDCNNNLCDAVAGAIGAVTLNPAFAILGVLGTFACLACQ